MKASAETPTPVRRGITRPCKGDAEKQSKKQKGKGVWAYPSMGAMGFPASTRTCVSIFLSVSPCSTRFHVVMRASFMSKSKMRTRRW